MNADTPPPAAPAYRVAAAPRRARPLWVFGAAFGVFFLLLALWSVATPLFNSPDEPYHVAKAVAVVHGQLLGSQPQGADSPNVRVQVPVLYSNAMDQPVCFAFKILVPASCAAPLTGASTNGPFLTYTGRYPPLYYAVVGIPSLFMTSASGIYVMRLVSALLNALFLALAVMTIVVWSRSRALLLGLAIAVTPEVLFFGGVVNPVGLEISAAICLWCSALVLFVERSDDPPPGLVIVVATSAAVTTLVRGLSPLWVAMIGISVVAFGGRHALVGLTRKRDVRVALTLIVASGGVAVAWILWAHTLDALPSTIRAAANASNEQILAQSFGNTGRFLVEMIGRFGWDNTPAPLATDLAWYMAIGLVAGIAFVVGRRRHAIVLGLVTVAAIFVPVLISASQARESGFVWQGKDSLPFALGVPLAAAAIIGQSEEFKRFGGRLCGIVTFGLAIASMLAFAAALRRSAAGVDGPIDFLSGPWRPPLGSLALLVAELMAALGLAGLLSRWAGGREQGERDRHDEPDGRGRQVVGRAG